MTELNFTSAERTLHPQLFSVICSFLSDEHNAIKLMLSDTDKYPYYTTHEKMDHLETRCNGLLHSKNDNPAMIWCHGEKSWWKNGQLHRDGDKPAITWLNNKEWYKHGNHHRDGGKPAVIHKDDDDIILEWHQDGILHRDGDKPAIICYGIKKWYKHGKLHRSNGPAVIYPDGRTEWWSDGVYATDSHATDAHATDSHATNL